MDKALTPDASAEIRFKSAIDYAITGFLYMNGDISDLSRILREVAEDNETILKRLAEEADE
jgi:hypothetical protein